MRMCPNCHEEMEDAYLVDQAIHLSDLHIIKKNEDYTKSDYPLMAAMCPQCGHIEFYVRLQEEK